MRSGGCSYSTCLLVDKQERKVIADSCMSAQQRDLAEPSVLHPGTDTKTIDEALLLSANALSNKNYSFTANCTPFLPFQEHCRCLRILKDNQLYFCDLLQSPEKLTFLRKFYTRGTICS